LFFNLKLIIFIINYLFLSMDGLEQQKQILRNYLFSLGNIALWSYDKKALHELDFHDEFLIKKILIHGDIPHKKMIFDTFNHDLIKEIMINNICMGRNERIAIEIARDVMKVENPKKYVEKLKNIRKDEFFTKWMA
jgi:hypothetical protein